MGVHDLIEDGIDRYIKEWHAREDDSVFGGRVTGTSPRDDIDDMRAIVVLVDADEVDGLVDQRVTLIREGPIKKEAE